MAEREAHKRVVSTAPLADEAVLDAATVRSGMFAAACAGDDLVKSALSGLVHTGLATCDRHRRPREEVVQPLVEVRYRKCI